MFWGYEIKISILFTCLMNMDTFEMHKITYREHFALMDFTSISGQKNKIKDCNYSKCIYNYNKYLKYSFKLSFLINKWIKGPTWKNRVTEVYQINQIILRFQKWDKSIYILEAWVQHDKFYNNISCNHKWSYSVNWWLPKKTFHQPLCWLRHNNFFSEASLLSRKAISGVTVALFQKLQVILSV